MVMAALAITRDREMVMDFTYPFYYGFTTIVMKRPDPNQQLWNKLVSPLNVRYFDNNLFRRQYLNVEL